MANDAAQLVGPWLADVAVRHDWARRAPNLVDSAGLDVLATSGAYCSQCVHRANESSAEAHGASGAPEDDGRQNYYIGECGHRVTVESGISGLFRIGPCHECVEEPL